MLDDLKAFVAAVDRGSLTRAADTLALTQSAVSRRIQQLESTLDSTLLDRSSKPLRATALGQRVYQRAGPLLREMERLLETARSDADPSGSLRLGLSQVVADIALFDAVLAMKHAFPLLELQCRTQWSTGLLQELQQGRLDAVALLLPHGASLPDDMHCERLASFDVQVVQSRKQPLLGREASLQDLSDAHWVLNPEGCGYRAALERSLASRGGGIRLSVDTHGTQLQLRLIAAGLGLSLAPRSLIRGSDLASELCVVRVEDFSLTVDVWLIHPRQMGNLQRAVQMLAQAMRTSLAQRERSVI